MALISQLNASSKFLKRKSHAELQNQPDAEATLAPKNGRRFELDEAPFQQGIRTHASDEALIEADAGTAKAHASTDRPRRQLSESRGCRAMVLYN